MQPGDGRPRRPGRKENEVRRREYTSILEVAVRRIRYAVATSLDGFIAGPNGEAD